MRPKDAYLEHDAPKCFDVYEREEYERWLDAIDANSPDYFADAETESHEDNLPF